MIQSNMKILSRTRKQIRSFSSQNWIYRNVKESLDGVNLKTETKNAIGIFFKKFYTDLEKSTELVETLKECRRETAKKEVFELLKANRPQEGKPLTDKEKVELQYKIKDLTLTFKDTELFPAAPEIVKMLIQEELPIAKDYLRARKLNDEDHELVGELGTFTVEALLIHVICTLYKTEKTHVRLATLIDQIERAVRTHAGLMRENRFKNRVNKTSDKQKGDDTSLVVDDSNILTDRSLDEPTPPQEIQKRNKKEKRFPIGTALVEMMDERGVIDMKVDNEEGAKVMRKRGKYYSQRAVQVACNFKLEDLPLKINLPMVCQPLDWEPKNPKFQPKTLGDLKGGYLTGRTANISDRYSLLSSKNVKNFRVLLNDEHEALCSIMNALQRQAFKINEEHLKYIKDNYQLLVNCNMLQPKFLCCINTKDIAEVLKKAFLNDPDIRKSVSFSFILTLLLNNIEQARYEKFILEMAKAFLGYDFYMPAFIDFRGRIYRSGILHFHERDLARSLIIFSDPKYKKGDEIDKILVTAAAFHFKSFKSVVEAQEWCKDILVPALIRIRDSNKQKEGEMPLHHSILNEFGIEDPSQDKPGQLSYVDIAKNAKDPFQFLSSILLNLHTGDPSFRYNSPITKDASASAFQIISYFLLDETMARRTNLIPDEKGRFLDIYSCMREELLDFIKERVSPVLYDTVLNQLTRKVVKSVYMPKIYGKTYKTTRDDLANKIGNDMEDKDCTQIAKLCFEFWNAQYGHFEDFIKLIQNIGWLTSSAGRPILYIIDFFTTFQDYMCSETDKVWVNDRRHMRKRQISFRRPSLKRDTWQSYVSTFVNFIHQRDAYIAMQVVLQLFLLQVPIYTVHDNFITTPGYSDIIAKCYSRVFQMMESPLYIINQFIICNIFEPLLKRKHPKIEHNEMLIALENAKKEQ
ncbi:DNA-dependent RNA polymerase [Tanacetum coccineum]